MTSQFRQGSVKLSAAEKATADKIVARQEGIKIVSKILAAVSPYIKDRDPKMRMAMSKTITRNILKALATKKPINKNANVIAYVNAQANQLLNSIDSTFAQTQRNNNYSYTPSDAAPNAKNVKIPPASTYSTFLECTEDLDTNYNVDPKISAEYCKGVNADSGQSGPSNIQGGIKKNIPSMPRTKQASIRDVAPWAVSLGVAEPNDIVTLDNSIKSASAIPSYYYDVDAAYSLERVQKEREERQELRDQKLIKSAREGIDVDAVHYAYAADYLP